MNKSNVIIELLGLQDVVIEDVKCYKKSRKFEIRVRQKRSESHCSRCGLQFGQVKEWVLKVLKGPPMGIYQDVTVKYFQLRGVCDDCNGTSMSITDWIHPKFESLTCGLAEVAGRLMEETTCEAVSRVLGLDSKQMWKLDQYRMEVMLQFLTLPEDLDLSYLAADEVHFLSIKLKNRKGLVAPRKKPLFVTNLVAPLHGKVLFNAMGRDSRALTIALSCLSEGRKLTVEKFALDMHEPFIGVVIKECPNAEVCIDRFHLAMKVNEAFDEVRKAEFRKAKKFNLQSTRNLLEPHRRFILVSRNKDLSKSEKRLVDKLRRINEPIHHAMLLVEYFHKALDKTTVKSFRTTMTLWCQLVRESKLEPFRKLAKTIRRYRKNIEAYIKSRLTTAVAEGLNNKIKVLKRMAYGYSNSLSFSRKILQRCGFLNSKYINTDTFYKCWPNPA